MSHIAVERNRRRQMNEHLKVLRSLTPCFYIKRGDQASIIGGVIEFIKELHQVLQSLESKKRRKSLSPSPSPSPRPILLQPIPQLDSTFGLENVKELGACCNSPVADIEAKISGSNVLLKVISRPIPGQIMRIISVLERLSFEVLHLNISSMEDTVLYSFVIKELHQVLQSLESKKRRKSLSPSPSPSPRPILLQPIPQLDSTFGLENVKELGACCNSPVADIEAKISGSNVLLKVISRPIPGQIMRIISVLERLSFEVLHLNISSMEDTVLYSFVIKI
ncbi:Transcription factor MUTE [Morella rubra]|uniref:Transcription factor MUTE n=1 Tax=Morella rubra TaxID=262757 RepID=A0A6A1VRQ2_9ROSI|nr:Transcription factor MUTE [Morella rubra]